MARQREFATQDDCRRALARVYRQLEASEIEVPRARTMIYCALSLSQVLAQHDLEIRLKALEAQVLGAP